MGPFPAKSWVGQVELGPCGRCPPKLLKSRLTSTLTLVIAVKPQHASDQDNDCRIGGAPQGRRGVGAWGTLLAPRAGRL